MSKLDNVVSSLMGKVLPKVCTCTICFPAHVRDVVDCSGRKPGFRIQFRPFRPEPINDNSANALDASIPTRSCSPSYQLYHGWLDMKDPDSIHSGLSFSRSDIVDGLAEMIIHVVGLVYHTLSIRKRSTIPRPVGSDLSISLREDIHDSC